MESLTTFILALGIASSLHFCLWWVRAQGLGLIAGFGFLCFVPMSLYALDCLTRSSWAPSSQLWTQFQVFAFFVGPVLLGLYQSRWLKSQWTPWLWTKAVFSAYAELVLAAFLGGMVFYYVGVEQRSLFVVDYSLSLLLLSCFGPCLGRFVSLAIPLVREAW